LESAQPLSLAAFQEINDYINDQMSPEPFALHFKRNKKETIWIIKGDSEDEIRVILQSIIHIKTIAETAFPITITLGIGSIQERLQGISISFSEAEEEKNFQYISRKYHMSHFKGAVDTFEQFIYLDRNTLIDFLKLGHFTDTAKFTQQYSPILQEIDWSQPIYVYNWLMDITVTVIQFIHETSKEHEMIVSQIQVFQKKIAQIENTAECLLFIQRVIECYLVFRESLTDKHSALIQKAKSFILKNYDVIDLSLQKVADEVKISSGHLSTVFSHETGQTFIEFLTHTRIRKAMELLRSTNAKSYEIAYQVGYNDSHYFSNLFKKVTGMTTKEFRKKSGVTPEIASLEESQ
jgi:two-component system response regulator YesN